jgi:hypothetical protein
MMGWASLLHFRAGPTCAAQNVPANQQDSPNCGEETQDKSNHEGTPPDKRFKELTLQLNSFVRRKQTCGLREIDMKKNIGRKSK